jgi:hypothetical protein
LLNIAQGHNNPLQALRILVARPDDLTKYTFPRANAHYNIESESTPQIVENNRRGNQGQELPGACSQAVFGGLC